MVPYVPKSHDFFGSTILEEDPWLYVKWSNKSFGIISLYVVDVLLAGMLIEWLPILKTGCP